MGFFTRKQPTSSCGCACGGSNCSTQPAGDDSAPSSAQGASEKILQIKVLGSGCAKCNALEAATRDALVELGLDPSIEHVTDFAQIAAYGIMSTPALVINEQVASYGRVLKTEEAKELIKKFMSL